MINEALLEQWTLTLFAQVGYQVIAGSSIAPDANNAERSDFDQVVLVGRLRAALARLNPTMPASALDDALHQVLNPRSPSLIISNREFHEMLVNGVRVEYPRSDGTIAGNRARLIDFDTPSANDWVVVNQFLVRQAGQTRRPDVVVFVNGLPLAIVELKNPTDTEATVELAHQQLLNYQRELSDLFTYNELLVVSDGVDARMGALRATFERFLPWRTIEGEALAPATMPKLQVLISGIFEHHRFLDLIRFFIVFEDDGEAVVKKIAAYHQFHAVNSAIESTIAATHITGSRKCGVVWHTQGSGKSLTMVFYVGRLVMHPAMENPTIIVLTDRNDLDNQLFDVFARCATLLRQQPTQATDRESLRILLNVASGSIIFTTIQKFSEEIVQGSLSSRRNIVVIADEAHRSQYGFQAQYNTRTGEISYGFAHYVREALPNASFLGFTGTPIEVDDRSTRNVFGDYISIYDIKRAVEDQATVPISYENRVAKLDLDPIELPRLDPEFEEVTEGEEVERKEALKTKWTSLRRIVGNEKRLALIAQDLVQHFEQRQQVLLGKAMIVCMSRDICISLYQQILKLRPEWQGDNDSHGVLKIIMTGSSSDPEAWQQHIRTKSRREQLAKRFRDPDTDFRLVIVRDMWLTGFDAPSLHTMYIDKPMLGHNLMQAIARVNRVFRDKPGGLVVDYIGLVDQLKQAITTYTESGGHGEPTETLQQAIDTMRAKYEICCDLFYGFDWSAWSSDNPGERISLLPAAQEHIFEIEDGIARLSQAVKDLSQAHALAMPSPEALTIRDDLAFFQAVRNAVTKTTASGHAVSDTTLDHAVQQLVSRAISPDKVIDIFEAAGLPNPDISILSDQFLEDVRHMPHKRLAVELLRKLMDDEFKSRARTNVVQSRTFSDLLERSIRAYQNRAIETIQVIEELIDLAKYFRREEQRGESMGLSSEELAFYQALEVNDSAVKVLGDEQLRSIAKELTVAIKKNISIDWTERDSVRASMRALVRRILRRNGYPPDKQEKATATVLEQAENLSAIWAV